MPRRASINVVGRPSHTAADDAPLGHPITALFCWSFLLHFPPYVGLGARRRGSAHVAGLRA